jgi:myo-inositol 2-dehydrogenase / D-chiro-inositol 1-dehydrogenase
MPTRIGVIGTGIMGSDHVETITTAVSGAEVCCIADIDAKRAKVIASRIPGAKALSSAESLIESPDVDSVIIASSDATHAKYVTACIAARKPVLCEKPLAPTVPECEEILRLEEAAGTRLVQVGFMRRFRPRVRRIAQQDRLWGSRRSPSSALRPPQRRCARQLDIRYRCAQLRFA